MSVHNKKPLTAQEAFEKFGYIPLSSRKPLEMGQVAYETNTYAVTPKGTAVVITGILSVEDLRDYCQEAGWIPVITPFIYKAVAE